MARRSIQALLAVALLGVAACGSGTTGPASAAQYSSARKVIAALDRIGLRCTGTSVSTPPVVPTASSEASCFRGSSEFLVDTFPDTVTRELVEENSVSTGSQKIWSAVGPDWWVQTTRPDAERIVKALGGRVIGGPWHPQPIAPPPPDALTAWQDGRGYALYTKTEAALKHVGKVDSNPAAIPAAGKALYKAALAAGKVPCPADRNGYKLEMFYFAAAGFALQFATISLAEKNLRKATAMTASVNAACGF